MFPVVIVETDPKKLSLSRQYSIHTVYYAELKLLHRLYANLCALHPKHLKVSNHLKKYVYRWFIFILWKIYLCVHGFFVLNLFSILRKMKVAEKERTTPKSCSCPEFWFHLLGECWVQIIGLGPILSWNPTQLIWSSILRSFYLYSSSKCYMWSLRIYKNRVERFHLESGFISVWSHMQKGITHNIRESQRKI